MKSKETFWTVALGVVLAGILVVMGSLYMDWYDTYHGELNAVMDCEQEIIDEYKKENIPLRMDSRELFDHCAAEVLAESGR